MHRAGRRLAGRGAHASPGGSSELPGLRMDGLSGYEGHCSLEMDRDARHEKQAVAMRYFVEVADHLEANGIPCPILSAAGTATAFWTGADPRITELQLGSYAAMDDYHYLMEPRFQKATTAVVTVISRRRDRLVLDLGKKTFGSADVGGLAGLSADRRPRGPQAVPLRRGARDVRGRRRRARCKVGDVVDFHLGYTPVRGQLLRRLPRGRGRHGRRHLADHAARPAPRRAAARCSKRAAR